MPHRFAARAALATSMALCSAACLLVSPLDDVPNDARGGAGGKGETSRLPEAGSGTAGSALPEGQCVTNADCKPGSAGVAYRCLPSTKECVPLLNETCPLSYGDASDPNALYFGAFATLSTTRPGDNSIIWAHRLALEELNGQRIGGLPGAAGGPRRPLVMVVCNNADAQVEAGVAHLIEDLELPAILATLKPGALREAYEAHRDRDVFFLSPVPVTSGVATEEDDGHIWSMLGQPKDFARPYAALLARAEAHVREQGIPSDTPTKVALVTTSDAFDAELADVITPTLRFNGKVATSNGPNFKRIEISAKPNVVADAEEIGAFEPDIIVSTASEQFTTMGGVQEELESEWEAYPYPALAKPRPFYILSPYNAGDLNSLTDRVSGRLEAQPLVHDQRRYVGISIASAPDSSLQNAYAVRLAASFELAISDTANYYDAVYFLAYAMYAAGASPLSGSSITAGMRRLLSGQSFEVGPSAVNDAFFALSESDATIQLVSTLGPPGFEPVSGVRSVLASAFCFGRTKNTATLEFDVVRFDQVKDDWSGNFPCIPGL